MEFKILMALGMLLMVAGCGGGGMSGPEPAASQPSLGIIKIAALGTLLPGSSLSGVGITLSLPEGVYIPTTADGAVTTGSVVASGVAAGNSSIVTSYTPATAAAPAKLAIIVASTAPAGFGTGEFVTVTTTITAGAHPAAADYGVTDLKPADLAITPVPGLTACVTGEFR